MKPVQSPHGRRRYPAPAATRLSLALVGILARMVEAKLAAAGSSPVLPASQPAQNGAIVVPQADEPAGRTGA